MIKVIAIDMDGTFLDDKGSYDRDKFAHLLDLCEERGWLFTIASGRALLALDKFFAPFKDRLAMVAENGSLVRYQDQVLFERHLTGQHCLEIIQALGENPFGQSDMFLLSGHEGSYVLKGVDPVYLEKEHDYHENIQIVESFDAIEDTIVKITAYLAPEHLEKGTAWLTNRLPDLTVVTTGFDAIDIILKGVHKRQGLEELCTYLGLTSDGVIAFGDNLNDLEMLDFAGKAVAVANARPEVVALADELIGHHKDGTVLDYLEKLLNEAVS